MKKSKWRVLAALLMSAVIIAGSSVLSAIGEEDEIFEVIDTAEEVSEVSSEQAIEEIVEEEISEICYDPAEIEPEADIANEAVDPDFIIEDGVLKAYLGEDRVIVIPDGVTVICEGVFSGNETLLDITIPASVKRIGRFAFKDCKNLKTVRINDIAAWLAMECDGDTANPNLYATKVYIDGEAVSELTLPEVEHIRDYGLFGFANLTKIVIPETVTSIGAFAFARISDLREIVLPESLTQLGELCFYQCFKLRKVSIPSQITEIPSGAFFFCYNMREVILPEGLTTIGEQAFAECWTLQTMEFPSTLKEIGAAAFMSATGMERNYPSQLKNIVLPDGVETIADMAFAYCLGLESIRLPDSLEEIGAGAFLMCTGLKEIVIPELEYLGESAFEQCSKLTKCEFTGPVGMMDAYVFKDCVLLKTVIMREGIETIAEGAFYNCEEIDHLYLPESLRYIGRSAFERCFMISGPDGIVTYAATEAKSKDIEIESGNDKLTKNRWRCTDNMILSVICEERMVLGLKENVLMTVRTVPENGVGSIKFASSAPKIAAINAYTGQISAKAVGTAEISVFVDGNEMAVCTIVVKKAASKIALTRKTLTLGVGESYQLTAKITGGSYGLTWKTSNEAAVSVDKGMIVANAIGVSKIKVKTFNGKYAECKVTVKPAPENVYCSVGELKLAGGDTYQLKATLNSGAAGKIRFESSDPEIAAVDENTGVIVAGRAGTAVITASTYNKVYDRCNVTVCEPITEIRFTTAQDTVMGVGEKLRLEYDVVPDDDIQTRYSFKSSNKTRATVSSNGVVKARRSGVVKITVKTYNGQTDTIWLIVKKAPRTVKLSVPSKTMFIGENAAVKVSFNKGAGSGYTLSSSTDAVRIEADGTITAVSEGQSVITAKSLANGKKGKITITVAAPTADEIDS